MEILRRTVSVLLTLVMIFTMLPVSVLAVGDGVLDVPLADETEMVETVPETTAPEVFLEGVAEAMTNLSGTCGENLTWNFDRDGTLTISGTGEMFNYANKHYGDGYIDGRAPWYKLNGAITSVQIEGGVTTIGNSAFLRFTEITNMTIPDSITSIGEYAFQYCKTMTDITIPDSVTSIGQYAFCGCEKLTDITLPEGITDIADAAFQLCKSLTSITIPDSVTTIGKYAFYGCSSLTSITIPDGVTIIAGEAFRECEDLTSIVIPDSVTTIDYSAFTSSSLTDVYYGGSAEQWADISIDGTNTWWLLTSPTIHYNSTGPDDIGPTPSEGPVAEYVDNSNIKINGSGVAWAHYIGEPNQEYTVLVNDEEVSVSANEQGVMKVFLGGFDSEGEKNVTVEFTHVGGEALSAPQEFQSTVTVVPLEFSQDWQISLDPSLALEFNSGGKAPLFNLEGSFAKGEVKAGVGGTMNISRAFSAEGETLELSSDKTFEVGKTIKCGITGSALSAEISSGPYVGISRKDTVSYGLKIDNYSAENPAQQMAVGTYLLGEILAVNSMNAAYIPFYQYLAGKYYQAGGFQVTQGSAARLSGTVGAKLGGIEINDRDIVSLLKGEVGLALKEAEKSASNGDREKSLSLTLETDLAVLALEGEEIAVDTSVLGWNFLGRDIDLIAKIADGKKSLEATSLSAKSTQMDVLLIGTPSTAVYDKYIYQDKALDGLLSSTTSFDDYLNKNLFVLSVLDLYELANTISNSDAHIAYESKTKEKYAVSIPLEFGISLGVGGTLGIDLSFLADTSYTTATGYAADDMVLLQSESDDLSEQVEAKKSAPIEIFTNCIASLAGEAASFFKKAVGKIQEGVDAGWSWVKEKGESAREWLIEITSAPSKNDGAWGESMEIGILGSYVNFSLARQAANPNDAYVTRTAMTVGRPFIVNVTDNATGETIGNFEEDPLEFTIRYAGEDLMAANYNAETQVISMYRYSDDGDYFEYIGGIHDAEEKTVTATITKPGQYILAAEAIEEEGCGFELGDVNHDTKINAKDATLILQKSVGVLKETAKFCETCAEVSGDGKLNAKDSTLILQFSVGLRDSFLAQK